MTQAEASRVLGISPSFSPFRIEQAYREKQRQLRLKLIPGNPLADRQKAQAELARLTTAWQILQASPAAKPHARKSTSKPASRKTARPKPIPVKPLPVNPHQKPQTLAEAWDLFIGLMPFPEPITVVLLIAVFLLTIVSFVRTFLKD